MSPITPRAVDPDFARPFADGLVESFEAYCDRIGETPTGQPAADPPNEEAAT
ncbi:hypothetical protein [Streptomyces nigrescens]|uniref:Uncharacterized protein n=1 Tax=Streptomyces nigrescens TaxID=1920 RepID=A0A640TCD8_STRNI|nr:hypothetical protein [Streptomyces libani]WAT94983.1 hypothetical protein STRLI_000656 [Streptomyces libani subsp. libani]GFE20141.1 hypothetical protein Sliba_05940 [Streptomyces libani subsp. libani]GGV85973.1 hypothetical protein GCM10010500_03380 [Streptomyces libani subsp. libani]